MVLMLVDALMALGWLPSQPGRMLMQSDACLQRRGKRVRKTSRRDLPAVMATRADGATTVSATMLLAAHAGIAVFATGGAPATVSSRLSSPSRVLVAHGVVRLRPKPLSCVDA